LADQVEHLLPTPTARDGKGPNQRQDGTCLHGALLPTPTAGNFNDGESPLSWQARKDRELAKGRNGIGTPLGIAVQLLPTPRASRGASATESVYLLETDGLTRNGRDMRPPSNGGNDPLGGPLPPRLF